MGSMGSVHMHQRIPTIKRCGSPSHVQSIVEKNGEDNQKARKISQIVSQVPTLRLKYDKIRAQWALCILSKSMLERV
jgi:hypothetical protein